MAKLQLNKANLTKNVKDLKNYNQFLPSLDMKRKQLLGAQKANEKELNEQLEDLRVISSEIGEKIPMLANSLIILEQLVSVKAVKTDTENVLGLKLPVLQSVEIEVVDYSYYSWPHWVDSYVEMAKQAIELRIKTDIWRERDRLLAIAVRKATQKVNLFDKVLIPGAKENIAKIKVYLSDLERAGVVTSKITKRKRSVGA